MQLSCIPTTAPSMLPERISGGTGPDINLNALRQNDHLVRRAPPARWDCKISITDAGLGLARSVTFRSHVGWLHSGYESSGLHEVRPSRSSCDLRSGEAGYG